MGREGQRRRRRMPWTADLGVTLAVVGLTLPGRSALIGDGEAGVSSAGDAPTAASTKAPFVVDPVVRIDAAKQKPTVRRPAAGRPTRLVVPRLGVDAPVIGIGVIDGVLLPPSDPQTLGWWSDGAQPGAAHGGALITGHTVHTGGGAIDDLETLRAGRPRSGCAPTKA